MEAITYAIQNKDEHNARNACDISKKSVVHEPRKTHASDAMKRGVDYISIGVHQGWNNNNSSAFNDSYGTGGVPMYAVVAAAGSTVFGKLGWKYQNPRSGLHAFVDPVLLEHVMPERRELRQKGILMSTITDKFGAALAINQADLMDFLANEFLVGSALILNQYPNKFLNNPVFKTHPIFTNPELRARFDVMAANIHVRHEEAAYYQKNNFQNAQECNKHYDFEQQQKDLAASRAQATEHQAVRPAVVPRPHEAVPEAVPRPHEAVPDAPKPFVHEPRRLYNDFPMMKPTLHISYEMWASTTPGTGNPLVPSFKEYFEQPGRPQWKQSYGTRGIGMRRAAQEILDFYRYVDGCVKKGYNAKDVLDRLTVIMELLYKSPFSAHKFVTNDFYNMARGGLQGLTVCVSHEVMREMMAVLGLPQVELNEKRQAGIMKREHKRQENLANGSNKRARKA